MTVEIIGTMKKRILHNKPETANWKIKKEQKRLIAKTIRANCL